MGAIYRMTFANFKTIIFMYSNLFNTKMNSLSTPIHTNVTSQALVISVRSNTKLKNMYL